MVVSGAGDDALMMQEKGGNASRNMYKGPGDKAKGR